jgi:hypothetical protein
MAQRMLRFLIGLTLLVFAITLPLHGPARVYEDTPPELYLNLLERLHPLTEAERYQVRKRLEERLEEARTRRLQDDMERDRVYGKMRSLAEVGPTFVFDAVDGLLLVGRVKAACLVGETGKIYMYDLRKDEAQAPSVADGREFSKAVDLAKSLEPDRLEWRPVPAGVLEYGGLRQLKWYVLLDGRPIPVQIADDYVGAHPNQQAAELVKLINRWCPYARRSGSHESTCNLSTLTRYRGRAGNPCRACEGAHHQRVGILGLETSCSQHTSLMQVRSQRCA